MKIIITESQKKSINVGLQNMIKNDGWKTVSKFVGGTDNLKKLVGIESPIDFLNLFNDLDVIDSEENPNLTLFRYKPKNNLIIYNIKDNYLYVNYFEIWEPLLDAGLFDPDIKELIKEWLSSVYNIRGVTPEGGLRGMNL